MVLTKPTKLMIYRDYWTRGEDLGRPKRYRKGTVGTALFNRRGMCCLGFLALEMGFEFFDIFDQPNPLEAFNEMDRCPLLISKVRAGYGYRRAHTKFVKKAMDINDEKEYVVTEKDREAQLKKAFEKVGIDLVFRDKAPETFRKRYAAALRRM